MKNWEFIFCFFKHYWSNNLFYLDINVDNTILLSLNCTCFRLVKTQVEVEMEVEQSAEDLEVEDFLPQEPIITIEEEEEVVLFWENGSKSKGRNQMARITYPSSRLVSSSPKLKYCYFLNSHALK